MERTFLYIDILGFKTLVKSDPKKVDSIFKIIDHLKVYKCRDLETIIFSDTMLVFNKENNRSIDYFCTYLIEYAQELFYKLSLIDVYFRGFLTYGDFHLCQMQNFQAYYGAALINAYENEKRINGFGLYVDKKLSNDILIFNKVSVSIEYDYILLCQSLTSLYAETAGVLPVDINILYETDSFSRIDEELLFFRKLIHHKSNYCDEKVRRKYQNVYDIYKNKLPLFFNVFEKNGFFPCVINPEYTGKINIAD